MFKNSRRKLLTAMVAGGGAVLGNRTVPESWRTPIVEAVILPAHAQTSPQPPEDEPEEPNCVATLQCASMNAPSGSTGVVDFVGFVDATGLGVDDASFTCQLQVFRGNTSLFDLLESGFNLSGGIGECAGGASAGNPLQDGDIARLTVSIDDAFICSDSLPLSFNGLCVE